MKTKKQYAKQLLSIVLSIIMLLSLIPSTVFATETGQKVVGTSTISNSPYLKGNTTFNEVLFNATRTDFRDESVYNLIITRFYDGDSSNNVHCWDDGMAGNSDTDPGWRGDFKGLIEKLDYIKALGFTALRLTPVAQNASGYDYHGYHPINLKEIDYRFESEGYTYEDLIDACHAKGLKVMQEVVINNTSNFGEENLRNLFDVNKDADWSDMTEALVPTDLLLEKYPNYTQLPAAQQFQARMDLLRESLNSDEIYHRETNMNFDNYLSQQGSMAGDCIDLNTENPVVALYLAESCFNYAAMGVDAIMLMSASHINRWTLNEGILPLLKDMLDAADLELDVYIEMVDRSLDIWNRNNPSASVQFYTWKETESQWQNNWDNTSPTANIQTSIDHYNAHSTLGDEPTSNNAVLDGITYHTPDHSNFSGMHIYDYNMMWNFGSANSAFNIAKYGDQYVNDATWNLTSVDNVDYGPDGMEKYRYSQGPQAWAENLNLMYTLRGIPSILYGTEIEFQKDVPIDVGPNLPLSKTGRAYYGDNMEGSVTSDAFLNFTAYGKSGATLSSPLSAHIRQLNAIRMSVPALRKGQYTTDGKYVSGNMAFIKRYTNESEEIDSLALVTITDEATFKNIPNGKYIDAVTGDVKNVTNGTLTATPIGRGNMRVYVCCAKGFTGLDASEMPAANRTLRFSANGGLGTVNSITVEGSEKAVLPECTFIAPSKTAFFGWNVNGTIYQPGDMVDISVNSMARAVWQSNANTVTYVADGAAGGYEKDFKHGEVITIPTSTIFEETFRKTGYTLTGWQGYTEGMTMPAENLTFTAIYTPNKYTVGFDTNGGEPIDPITVTFHETYNKLPFSPITGLSGDHSSWYLVDSNGTVTDTNITNSTKVSIADHHTLFIKRSVLSPDVSVTLTVSGASPYILTASIGNMNTDILDYTYQWYKDTTPIAGATSNQLTLTGNLSDNGIYKVEVRATIKDDTNIVVTANSAIGSGEQKVEIGHTATDISYGDVNSDGKINAVDALEVLKATVGKVKLTEEQFIKADTDGNGKINAVDALYILKKTVNKIDKFPVEK